MHPQSQNLKQLPTTLEGLGGEQRGRVSERMNVDFPRDESASRLVGTILVERAGGGGGGGNMYFIKSL